MKLTVDTLLDALPALILQLDSDGRIIDYRASSHFHNHPLPDDIKNSIEQLLPSSVAYKILTALSEPNKDVLPIRIKYSLPVAGAEWTIFEATINYFSDQFICIIQQPSTDPAEAAGKQLMERLQQSQKMEALGQLTGGIAHDFNNILASILGYADLTLDAVIELGEKTLARYQREIIHSGEKARDLIVQMLAFARARPSDPITLMPSPLLKESAKMLQSVLPPGIVLSVHTEEDLPSISIDPVQLHQAIVNLCINAGDEIKDSGNINISVIAGQYNNHRCDACNQTFSGDYVEISFSDSGPGIDPAIIDKIFDPYFSTKNNIRNSGTGLSVVNSIVHDNYGHISVEAYPKAGTVLRLYFPAMKTTPLNISDTVVGSGNIDSDYMPDAVLLVVDDEESIANLQGEVLKNNGLTVLVFSDAIQALNTFKIAPNQFDLILTDQTMPSLTGIELAKEALAIRPDIPIILSNAQTDTDFRDAAAAAGIQGYLTKPVPSIMLINMVRDLLLKNKKGAAAP